MKKILILGSTGLLGKNLSIFLNKNYKVFKHSNSKKSEFIYDLTKYDNIKKMINISKPNIIINCVGYTNVDDCENNFNKAYEINAKINLNLSKILIKKNILLIHISTDQVYSNKYKNYSSENLINLINNYAISKYLGEIYLTKLKKTIILRTNFFGYGDKFRKNSFCNWILQSAKKNIKINLANDIYFNPISINSFCKIIEYVIQNPVEGTYNLGSKNGISKYNFAILLLKHLNINSSNILKSNLKNLDLEAVRPKNMLMDCKKFETTYNIILPNIQNEINNL